MRRFYNDTVEPELKVSRTMFHEIFTNEFNINPILNSAKQKQPACDACKACVLWSNKIKSAKDQNIKQGFITEKRVDKVKANAFYDRMKADVPNSISFCLPKTPIQDAYYSVYIFIIHAW